MLPFVARFRRNVNMSIVENIVNQLARDRLLLRQQLERNEQQLQYWIVNIMMESSQLISSDFLYMTYICSPHLFSLERGPQQFDHVRYGTFQQWWYVRHPYLTDDLGRNSFQMQYRMSRKNFETLLNIVCQHQVYEGALSGNAYPVEIQVATVLWRLANTHFGYRLAEQFLGISSGSYTRYTLNFLTAMTDNFEQFVNWGVHDVEIARKKSAEFERRDEPGVRLPNVIGAIDGKLINIQKPRIHGNAWIDRHNEASMNLLAVCDANKRFMFIRTGQTGTYYISKGSLNLLLANNVMLQNDFVGRVNDARLFTDSSLYTAMLFDHDHYFPNNTIILGGAY
jgi:hypothetical protein